MSQKKFHLILAWLRIPFDLRRKMGSEVFAASSVIERQLHPNNGAFWKESSGSGSGSGGGKGRGPADRMMERRKKRNLKD